MIFFFQVEAKENGQLHTEMSQLRATICGMNSMSCRSFAVRRYYPPLDSFNVQVNLRQLSFVSLQQSTTSARAPVNKLWYHNRQLRDVVSFSNHTTWTICTWDMMFQPFRAVDEQYSTGGGRAAASLGACWLKSNRFIHLVVVASSKNTQPRLVAYGREIELANISPLIKHGRFFRGLQHLLSSTL